jgi:ABC-type transport system involved in multi-copper enzyme maturation permease subunit
MSFQTGRRAPGGAATRLDRLLADPNPVWIREMKQSARLTRTPFILMGITLLMVLIIGTVGGVMSTTSDPALIGTVIFHTFFSLAFLVVALAGPAVAANSIASEREGRTWEALQLTGLPPAVIARGKFLAAYTSVALYVVMVAPVGAMAFLFGGVTALETIAAFVWLFILAGLSVAFGLAISSKMQSLRGAILVTLFVALMVVPQVYLVGGVGGSFLAHSVWPLLPEGPPVWLPVAYARAPLDLRYVGLLVLAPLAAVILPAWFLYEVTVANLTSITEDRSTGLRRWFLVASLLLSAGGGVVILSAPSRERAAVALVAHCVYFAFLAVSVFVFQGEPIGPSRRVELDWERRKAGAWARVLGPGVMPAARVMLVSGLFGVLSLVAATLAGLLLAKARGGEVLALLLVAVYGFCFFLFLVGFAAWLRARTSGPALSRVILGVALFFAAAGPWVLAALVGSIARGSSVRDVLIAAPSPLFAVVAIDELRRTTSPESIVAAALLCAVAWALLGLGLLGAASLRCARVIRDHKKAIAVSDAFLRAEDEAPAAVAANNAVAPSAEAVAPDAATPGAGLSLPAARTQEPQERR